MRGNTHTISPVGGPGRQRRRALVVFASLVGDIAEIAQAVADGLDDDFGSTVVEARDVDPHDASEFDLIVTGEPSHMFGTGIGRPEDQDAAEPDDADEKYVGMKAWLTNVPRARKQQFCVSFDTWTRSDTFNGEPASVGSIRILNDLGYLPVSRQTFHVASIGGPLIPGELDRARAWARSLAARIPASSR